MLVKSCAMVLASVLLVGCADVSSGIADRLSAIGGSQDATGEGIRTLSLMGGDVRVRGPEGYCVDQSASNARRGFAVLAGCALLSDDAAVMPNLDGLITVQFGDEGTASVAGNEDAFAAFLETDAGRAVLAANGDPATMSQVATITDREGVLARFEDVGAVTIDGTGGPQWRGFLDVRGRLVTISIISFERDVLTRSEGERLLVVAMAELAEVNTPEVAGQ